MTELAITLIVMITATMVALTAVFAVAIAKLPEGTVKDAVRRYKEKRDRIDLVYDEFSGTWTWGPVE